jgi:hypothetical protein
VPVEGPFLVLAMAIAAIAASRAAPSGNSVSPGTQKLTQVLGVQVLAKLNARAAASRVLRIGPGIPCDLTSEVCTMSGEVPAVLVGQGWFDHAYVPVQVSYARTAFRDDNNNNNNNNNAHHPPDWM